MADLGDNNGSDNGFEKVPTAAELSASYIEEIGHALPTVSESLNLKPEKTSCGSWLKTVDPRGAIVTPYKFQSMLDLIYWRNLRKTGVVFGSLLVLLMSLALFSVLSVISYLSLVTLTVTISYRIYKNILAAVQKTGEGHPFQHFLDMDISLPTDTVHNFAGEVTTQTLSAINELRRLFLVDDLVDSIKFGLLLWILTYVGAWFNGMTIIIIATSLLFSVPKIYEMYKVEIDQFTSMVKKQVNAVWNQIKEKLPMLTKKKAA